MLSRQPRWFSARTNPHWWLLAFCGGVVAVRFLVVLPAVLPAVAVTAAVVLCAIWLPVLRAVAAFAIGFCWAVFVSATVADAGIPAEMERRDVVVLGQVVGAPVVVGRYQRFDFEVAKLVWDGVEFASPGTIRLKFYRQQPRILSGEKWRFTVRLKRARGYRNPGAQFDYETYLFHHRLRATGYIRATPIPHRLAAQPAFSITAFRQRVAEFIREVLRGREDDFADEVAVKYDYELGGNFGDEVAVKPNGERGDNFGNERAVKYDNELANNFATELAVKHNNEHDDKNATEISIKHNDKHDGERVDKTVGEHAIKYDNELTDNFGNKLSVKHNHQPATNPPTHAGLIAALTVGIRSDMTARDWEVLLATGTIHLVAISGLHIGLVAGLALFIGAWCWRALALVGAGSLPLRVAAPQVGVVVGLAVGLVYALLAGMTIPTQRAVCMLAVVAVALFFRRRAFGSETLLIALAVVLAVDPLAPLSGGFWLSFGAVVVLVIGALRARLPRDDDASAGLPSPPLSTFSLRRIIARLRLPSPSSPSSLPSSPMSPSPSSPSPSLPSPSSPSSPSPPKPNRILHHLTAWSAIQLTLFAGMLPLLLVLFQRASTVAPLANLLAIPVVGMLAVPLSLLGLALYASGLEAAAALAFAGALAVLDALWIVLEYLADAAWSVWRQPPPPWWSLPPAAVGVLLLLAPKATPARWCGALFLLPLFAPLIAPSPALAPAEFRYTMLEVGHGLASVVRTKNHVLLYDAGPKIAGGLDAGLAVVAPYLWQAGVKKIDTFVVSHGDNDHIGGHDAVRRHFAVGRVLTSAVQEIAGAGACYAGQKWRWDEVDFAVLWPPRHTIKRAYKSGNDASCVIKISSRFGSLLLTGDIGKHPEAQLVAADAAAEIDLLQVPHHGSKTSSTAAFLRHTNPTVAVVSTGYLNRYAHPNPEVAARYTTQKIPVYNTANEGALTTNFTKTGIKIKSHRATNRNHWLQPAKHLQEAIRLRAK